MMNILKVFVVPPNLLRAIGTIYTGTRAKMVTPDGNNKEFATRSGVLHQDTLAPFFFNIVLQSIGFTTTPKRFRQLPAVVLMDIGLCKRGIQTSQISDCVEQAQELLTRVETERA